MDSVGIVGVGLIGGSFGLALRKFGFTGTIVGVSSPATVAAAVARGAIDKGVTLDEAAATCDLLYLAQPIGGILATIGELGKASLQSGCLITDAGSTKSDICQCAQRNLAAGSFLGGHPMAGKELRGVGAADPDLFHSKSYVLTPDRPEFLSSGHAPAFVHWLKTLGANVMIMNSLQHDKTVALTSHLPQLLSTSLSAMLARQNLSESELAVSGSGLRDMSRLALSSFDIWQDILCTNCEAIESALSLYIDNLTQMRDNLQNRVLSSDFALAAEMANRIKLQHSNKHQTQGNKSCDRLP
jgi:prephenate dehydrogenase